MRVRPLAMQRWVASRVPVSLLLLLLVFLVPLATVSCDPVPKEEEGTKASGPGLRQEEDVEKIREGALSKLEKPLEKMRVKVFICSLLPWGIGCRWQRLCIVSAVLALQPCAVAIESVPWLPCLVLFAIYVICSSLDTAQISQALMRWFAYHAGAEADACRTRSDVYSLL